MLSNWYPSDYPIAEPYPNFASKIHCHGIPPFGLVRDNGFSKCLRCVRGRGWCDKPFRSIESDGGHGRRREKPFRSNGSDVVGHGWMALNPIRIGVIIRGMPFYPIRTCQEKCLGDRNRVTLNPIWIAVVIGGMPFNPIWLNIAQLQSNPLLVLLAGVMCV